MNDVTDAADFIVEERRNARNAMVGSLDGDPDKAARAIQLEQATGVPAPIIHGDLDTFEANHKANLTSQLLKNNEYLSSFLNSHPLAADVSSDDMGQLDAVSAAMSKIGRDIGHVPRTVLAQAAAGFKEGFEASGPYGSWIKPEDRANYPAAALGYTILGMPIELFSKLFSATLAGLEKGSEELGKQLGFDPGEAKRGGRDIKNMFEQHLMGFSGIHHGMGRTPKEISAEGTAEAGKEAKRFALPDEIPPQIIEAFQAAKPYLDAGLEPPVGTHPLIDQVKSQQAKLDAKNLDDALKESSASATRERAPEMFANFIRQHTEAEIGISLDAVRELYGEKEPRPEDGILGWVPGINDKLRTAAATGGDITVPLADWLAKVEPQVASKLHDDLRVRHGGVTLNEAKELPKPKAESEAIETKLSEEAVPVEPAVEAIRQQAALKPLFEEPPKGWDSVGTDTEPPRAGEWVPIGKAVEGFAPEKFTAYEAAIASVVEAELARIVPKKVEVEFATRVRKIEGDKPDASGVYTQFTKRLPTIVLALANNIDIPGVARHEAIHHLRAYGFFTEAEWSTLKKAAEEEGWVNKERGIKGSSIADKYSYLKDNKEKLLEEAIADEFRYWNRNPDSPTLADKIFQKLRDFLNSVKAKFDELASKNPDVNQIFKMIESGEIGSREGTKARNEKAFDPQFAEQGELDVTRQEDLAIFAKAKAIGMTADQYKRYLKLIEKRGAEDVERQLANAMKEEKRRQTKEWKENEARVREEVGSDIANRPDIAVGDFFINGVLHGEKLKDKPKLRSSALTEEQRKSLPPGTTAVDGMLPDEIAGLFGYQSGEAMVARFIEMNQARGAMQPKEFVNAIIKAETERRMQKQYGDLDENILAEAKDHVTGVTQMDLLHEETAALGMKAGAEMSYTKEEIQGWVRDNFAGMRVRDIDTDKMLNAAGKAGRAAELSLLKDDALEAFRQKQFQYYSMLYAKEAKKFEKDQARFDRTIKRFTKRDVPNVDPQNTNFIHDIMMRIGRPAQRSVQDLAEAIAGGEHKTLKSFYESRNLRGLPDEIAEYNVDYNPSMPVADFLFDANYRKSVEQMTAAEFRAVNNSLTALAKQGRDEFKINKQGADFDRAQVKAELIDSLKTLGEKNIPFNPSAMAKAGLFGKRMFAGLLQLEAIFDRFDRGNPNGPFTQFLMRPLLESGNHYSTLQREYSAKIRALEKYDAKLGEKIDNDVFYEPLSLEKDIDGKYSIPTSGGQWLPMTRANLRAVLLNVGNASNFDKLARGYNTTSQAITAWLDRHATKADWEWAQAVGDIFKDIQDLADRMTMNLSGTTIEKIPITPIQNQHGTFPGWYFPEIYDRTREGGPKGDMEAIPNIRAMTSRGFEKKRTGYAGPVDLSIETISDQISRRLKDVAFRPALIEASKFFYDKEFRAAMTKHYGAHYTALLEPYLKDVAGQVGFKSSTMKAGERFAEGLRQNIIGVLIGWNPGTVMKHGPTAFVNSVTEVGGVNFAKATYDLFKTNDATADNNYHFIRYGGKIGDLDWKGSEEVNRRMQHWEETVGGAQDIALGKLTLRQTLLKLGSKPVAWSDMASVLPTWLAKYNAVMDKLRGTKPIEEMHGDAVFQADRAVRRAHGSTAITSRPELVRSGPMGRMMTSLYGFFNHVFQRYYRMSWQAKEIGEKVQLGEPVAKDIKDLTVQFVSYVVFPAMIEEWVTPLSNDEKESWAKKTAKMLAKTISSSVPVVRDIAHSVLTGHDPSTSIIQAGYKSVSDMARDLSKGYNKSNVGSMIQHSLTLAGVATGLTSAQMGRTGKFLYNYGKGLERPRSVIFDKNWNVGGKDTWVHGLRAGTLKEFKH